MVLYRSRCTYSCIQTTKDVELVLVSIEIDNMHCKVSGEVSIFNTFFLDSNQIQMEEDSPAPKALLLNACREECVRHRQNPTKHLTRQEFACSNICLADCLQSFSQ